MGWGTVFGKYVTQGKSARTVTEALPHTRSPRRPSRPLHIIFPTFEKSRASPLRCIYFEIQNNCPLMQNSNSPISKDKLNFLNSLLDKELEQLRSHDAQLFHKTNPLGDHEPICNQSSIRALSNNPHSRIGNSTIESQAVLNNHSDLNDLQEKIFNLENKIQKNIAKQQQIQHHQGVSKPDSDDETPLKNKYGHSNSNKKKIHFIEKKVDKSIEYRRGKKTSPEEPERLNKFRLEKSIENAESKLSQSKATYRKVLNQSQVKSKSRDKSARNLSSQTNLNDNKEVGILQNKIAQMRKQMEDDRQNLVKEKQKSQQLAQQVEQLNKKLKKAQQQTEKQTSLETEYQRLLENFEKSEYIRQQQKNLIQTLKSELEELKAHKEEAQNQKNSNSKNKKKKKVLDENKHNK